MESLATVRRHCGQALLTGYAQRHRKHLDDDVRYDTIEEFNVDSKAECGQLNLAHVARN